MTYHVLIDTAQIVHAVGFDTPFDVIPDGLSAIESADRPWPGQVHQSNGSFADPLPPAPDKAALIAYANRKQVALRDGGITVNIGSSSAPQEVDVASDANGRGLVTGCVQLIGLASQNSQPAPTFPWINNDGTLVTLTAAQMMTIGYALGAFVQATYSTLGTALAAIENGTITTEAGVDTASWPSTSA